MSEVLQNVIVGFAAAGAAAVIVRRLIGEFRPRAAPPACEHCAIPALATPPRKRDGQSA